MSIVVVKCADPDVGKLAEVVFTNARIVSGVSQDPCFPELRVEITRAAVQAMLRWIDICRSSESSSTTTVSIETNIDSVTTRFHQVFPVQMDIPCVFSYSHERADTRPRAVNDL